MWLLNFKLILIRLCKFSSVVTLATLQVLGPVTVVLDSADIDHFYPQKDVMDRAGLNLLSDIQKH